MLLITINLVFDQLRKRFIHQKRGVSSANRIISRSAMISDKSFINMLSSRGPRIEPCGTAQKSGTLSEAALPNKIYGSTKSKAFLESIQREMIFSRDLTDCFHFSRIDCKAVSQLRLLQKPS